MKQIRLKDKIEIIEMCSDCPCANDDRCICNVTQNFIDWFGDKIEDDCPLEEYIETVESINCPDRISYFDKEPPNCIYSDMDEPCCIDGTNYRQCELTRLKRTK